MTTETPVCEPDTGLVVALWRFVEDSGTTEEFFALRCRVREHGALYDSAPALLKALETLINEAIPKANRFLLDMLPPEKRAIYDDCLAAIAQARRQA
jgi:hypothetical protein